MVILHLSLFSSYCQNNDKSSSLLFLRKETASIIHSYQYITFPVNLQSKKELLSALKTKLEKIESFKKSATFFPKEEEGF